jgi:hypothetical protein
MDSEALERLTRRPEDFEKISEDWSKYINIGDDEMSNLDFYILLTNYQSELSESSYKSTNDILPPMDIFIDHKNSDYILEPEIETTNNDITVDNPSPKSSKPKQPALPPNSFRKVKLGSGNCVFECTINNCLKRFTRKAENAKAHWL